MRERILHHIWQNRLYSHLTFYENIDLDKKVKGEVFAVGVYNTDAGPDFLEAKIQVGKLLLAGNVEIHHRASEWLAHKHHQDPAYDGVILHVVLEADRTIIHRTTRKPLLTAVMHCSEQLLRQLEQEERAQGRDNFAHSETATINKHHPEKTPPAEAVAFANEAEALYLRRLEEKSLEVALLMKETAGDTAEALHRLILKHLGAKVNNNAFLQLATSLPLRILRKHTDSVAMLEALYLGQASLLEDQPALDSYQADLATRYQFLATKYALFPIAKGCVRMLRLRPPAFPHRRLAIAATLRAYYPLLESILLEENQAKHLEEKLSQPPSHYWQNHYAFNKQTPKPLGGLSPETIRVLLINVVLPYRYTTLKGKATQRELLNKLLALAYELPPEKNRITNELREKGYIINSALHAQAAIQWYKERQTLYL